MNITSQRYMIQIYKVHTKDTRELQGESHKSEERESLDGSTLGLLGPRNKPGPQSYGLPRSKL